MLTVEGRNQVSAPGTNLDANVSAGTGTATGLDRLMASGDGLARFRGEEGRHVVAEGETLSGIAARHGTTWQTLARINGLSDPDRIAVGQRLELPSSATPARVHVVRPGETLSGIAQASGTSVAALARANNLSDPDLIRPGQRLTVSGNATATAGTIVTGGTPRPADATSARIDATAAADARITPDASSVRAADIAAQRAAGHQSIGKCYAWVKTALQQAGAVPDYMPGVAAKDAGPALQARGFVNLLDRPDKGGISSPYDAPKGAVLVYGAAPGATDRNARYGHIEIRTGSGFASDYASANARTGTAANGLEGRGRVLIGVYVKPAAGMSTAPAPTTNAPAPAGANGTAYAADNLRLGANEGYRANILEAAQRTGMAPQTVAAIINAETLKDGNGVWLANAKAGTSSATGMTQFLRGTWLGEATRAGSILNQEAKAQGFVDAQNRVVDEAGLLAARNDARLSILAGADYARSNVAALTRSGHVPADASPAAVAKFAYLAHHEGLGGARGFLDGNMGYLRSGTFEANVPASSRQRYLDAVGGNEGAAYRNWLSDYTDRRIDVTLFMNSRANVDVPATRSLFR